MDIDMYVLLFNIEKQGKKKKVGGENIKNTGQDIHSLFLESLEEV